MASHLHQALLLWVTRRMETDGYRIAGYDGQSDRGGIRNVLPQPFLLAGMRPDAWAVHSTDLMIAFAEAKTSNDIDTKHTRSQLRVFSSVKMRGSGVRCPLYVAVPESGLFLLEGVLSDLRLSNRSNIVRLGLPDIILRAA